MLERSCGPDTPPPDIVPGGSGDLQVEWHTRAGDIELHVLRPNLVHAWWAVAGDDVGEERVLTNDFSDIVVWIRDITETLVVTTTAAA
jgi:hypothetical protein